MNKQADQSPQNPQSEKSENGQSWLGRAGWILGSILVIGFIRFIFWSVNENRNKEIELQNDQVKADVYSEVDSLSDLENEIESGELTERVGNIEIGELWFEPLGPNKIQFEMELINHGSQAEDTECAVKAGETDLLRKVHVETYNVPPGSHLFTEIIEIANAESEFLEAYVECLAYE